MTDAFPHGEETSCLAVPRSQSPLYKAIDALNSRFGKGKVFSASEGIGDKSWKMKRTKLSKRASTRWDELMVVK